MIRTLSLATASALALGALLPVAAASASVTSFEAAAGFGLPADTLIEKRRPRTPGGSGCDSPRDVAEHPECRA